MRKELVDLHLSINRYQLYPLTRSMFSINASNAFDQRVKDKGHR